MTKETIIKSTLKYLVKRQIEEGSVGFAVDNDPDHDCCWDDVLAWIEAQSSEEDFVKHKKEVLERIAKREREIDKYMKELEALEQQPCEDCISREAVLDIIDFEDEWLFDAKSHNANTHIAFSGLESRVKALSSVTPQRPKGKWEKHSSYEGVLICSNCNCGSNLFDKTYKFCPNCGAEMEDSE